MTSNTTFNIDRARLNAYVDFLEDGQATLNLRDLTEIFGPAMQDLMNGQDEVNSMEQEG